ncbi:M20 family metallopeptidase [Thermotoga neapolitana]|uniref:Hydrolase, ama/hipO/hyuC family n=1 Tax=Thermotoga neapolitana (strain ATCC 49049 / DSM 4359 / NBRC 107923 / NS-E) TaxID=309803 RepID=B9K870_THENN|nr:M20 family metallopeptidase [Thermotoga neapolitana]ACM23153.1 Hydrolase, ama/hipO/hyuC family [Thermotoga neapolitana DSM 4359]KFZ21654.1 Hydrolase, ama/hipO/hyuC family protein [Thermotoga neapolitana LA10]HBF11568.1 amidohydrolase [Thermotoga neapolitana]
MDEIELRHLLHMNPEPSFKEFKTQEILKSAIQKIGYGKIMEVAGTGLVVEKKETEGPYVVLRAEMDALPIKEETGWEFASRNDYMHACGHDFHMSALFGAMKRLKTVRKNFLFVFQPAEETGGGAKEVVEFLRKNYTIKAAVGFHVTDEYDVGTVVSRAGVLFASATEFDVYFKGVPAHIAFAEKGKDALKVAVSFLHWLYGRKWDALVGVGKIVGGRVRNVVPSEVKIEGTIRAKSLKIAEEILSEMKNQLLSLKDSSGVDFSLEKGSVYPEVKVNADLLEILKKTCERLNLRFIECEMKKTGEDFGYFTQVFPSLSFWFGVGEGEKRVGLHHPCFLPKDEYIPLASELLAFLAEAI